MKGDRAPVKKHVVISDEWYKKLKQEAKKRHMFIYQLLDEIIKRMEDE